MAKQANSISDELLAAFMDGNSTLEETLEVLDAVASDEELQELIQLSMQVDEDMEADLFSRPSSPKSLPMLERVAKSTVDNLCAIRCEGYALRSFGIDVSDETLEQEAKENNWLREDGMPLHNVGLLSILHESYTIRRFCCTIDDIVEAIKARKVVISVIDNTELDMSPYEARRQDMDLGEHPNHAIVIKSLNRKEKTIEILEPGVSDSSKTLPLDVFFEAWSDSANYLVTVSNHTKYEPNPMDLSDVELEDELAELREAIAENAHEVWAKTRKDEGWMYGPELDGSEKTDPNLLPYDLLPEKEKERFRQISMESIKFLKKLGWRFINGKQEKK